MTEEYYLGDGVYVSFDGFAVTLRAPREHGDHFIVLEPRELQSLVDYVRTQRAALKDTTP